MSLTFYRAPFSTATVTELVLEELGVPHETVTLDLKKGDTKKPEHRKLDPNGRVPVLVHDGVPIWESAAITIHLGEAFGTAKKLWPDAGPKRGEATKWVVWMNVTAGDAIQRFLRDKTKEPLEEALRILDGAFDGRPFLCGAEYTLADTHANAFVDWLRHLNVDLAAYPRIEAWGKRCADRPAHQRVMARGE